MGPTPTATTPTQPDIVSGYLQTTFDTVVEKIKLIIAKVQEAVQYVFAQIKTVRATLTDCYKMIKDMVWKQLEKLFEFGKAFIEQIKVIALKVYTCIVEFFKKLAAIPKEMYNFFAAKPRPA